MNKKFVVMSCDKLDFGYNVNLNSYNSSDIKGLSYWCTFTKEKTVNEIIELDMDTLVIVNDTSKEGHDIRVIKPKE